MAEEPKYPIWRVDIWWEQNRPENGHLEGDFFLAGMPNNRTLTAGSRMFDPGYEEIMARIVFGGERALA